MSFWAKYKNGWILSETFLIALKQKAFLLAKLKPIQYSARWWKFEM